MHTKKSLCNFVGMEKASVYKCRGGHYVLIPDSVFKQAGYTSENDTFLLEDHEEGIAVIPGSIFNDKSREFRKIGLKWKFYCNKDILTKGYKDCYYNNDKIIIRCH